MIISDEVFPYLVLQKGEFYWLNGDKEAWAESYDKNLHTIFSNIEPWLPKECNSILDIGGGMGGIDIVVARHYGNDPLIAVVDGKDDPPIMTKHNKTFNNLRITRDFMFANGVDKFAGIDAANLPNPIKFDLIMSHASWCFHYAPEVYLDWVVACCNPDTTLIIDTRIIHDDWLDTLNKTFNNLGLIDHGVKHNRYAFRGLR